MATQYDPSSGTFVDDGVDDTPADYTQPLKNALNGDTQPPPVDRGYAKPLQKALAQTAAAQSTQNPESPGGQDGLGLPSVDVDKIADKVGHVGTPTLDGPGTRLDTADETKYQAWKATLPPRLQSESDYDLRGFYKENPTFSVNTPGQHMTDKFKLPNHDTFSNESQYYPGNESMGGVWQKRPDGGYSFIPNDPTKKQRIDEDAQGNRIGTPSGAPLPAPGAPATGPNAPATQVRRTVLSPEQQQAITQLDTATNEESAAQKALGETRAQKADVEAEGAKQRALAEQQRAQRIQDRLARAQSDYDARVKEYDQQYTKLKSMHETDFYADKSVGYRIGAAISIALGAVSQAFGGKNVGAELIEKEIEQHAARQRQEIVNQREVVEKAGVGLGNAKAEADRQATLWEAAALDRSAADVTARAAQFGGQEERQKAQAIAAQLQAKSAEKKALLLKLTGEQVVTDTGRQTEEERLRLEKERAKARAKAKGTGGPAASNSGALQELIDGQSAADVQAKYKLSDKALGKLVDTASKAQKTGTNAANENNPLAVRRTDGSVAGLAASTKNVDALQTRYRNYEDAIHSLRELAASGKIIPVGSDLFNRAVLAVAAVSTNNITDHTTDAEAATLKGYGLLNQDAIKRTLDHVETRFRAFDKQIRPVRETTASGGGNPYVDAAKAAKEKMSGGGPPPPNVPDPRIDLARKAVASPNATAVQKKNAQAFLDAHGG